MTYTSHGHHIPGSPKESGDLLPKARCGGPGLCGLCSSQSATWQQEAERLGILQSLDSELNNHEGLINPVVFQSRIVQVEAIQFTGGASIGMDIEAWINANGGNATWQNEIAPWVSEDGKEGHSGIPEKLTVQTPGGFMEAPVGDWIIRGTKGEFYPCSDDVFHEKYEEIIKE